ncbi:LuxR C-terminal-related transcriptional regulator [Nocardioides sp. CN2-186]|uniref:helix-turn-helix domain-containing protein n=1 Tax=Nocardioides tweenelious TaxID=3156607 RepID=UPI0032B45E10
MSTSRWRDLDARLREAIAPDLDRAALAEVVYAEVARYVPYDFACFATTDPASGVITWASKTRSLGVGDEEFAATEYGPPDVNKFEDIARRSPPVGALHLDTDGDPDSCRRHRDYMRPRFGFTDELRAAFVSRGATWGALALYRAAGDPPFTADDAAQVAGSLETVAAAIQRSLFSLPPDQRTQPAQVESDGPAVLIVDASDQVTHLTPAARVAIEQLGGWDHGALPASLLAVVASSRSSGDPLTSRTLAESGTWMSLRAARLTGAGGGYDVVVSVEATPRATLSRLALAAHGLTAREEEVALLVLQGVNTEGISSALHLSPHTVQDHLKVIFAKVGVRSRRELTARLVLT